MFKSGSELAAEDATDRGNGKKEARGGSYPSGTIGRKTASRNNVVYVRMMLKVVPQVWSAPRNPMSAPRETLIKCCTFHSEYG